MVDSEDVHEPELFNRRNPRLRGTEMFHFPFFILILQLAL